MIHGPRGKHAHSHVHQNRVWNVTCISDQSMYLTKWMPALEQVTLHSWLAGPRKEAYKVSDQNLCVTRWERTSRTESHLMAPIQVIS